MPEFPEMVGHILGFTAPMRFAFRVVRCFFFKQRFSGSCVKPCKEAVLEKAHNPLVLSFPFCHPRAGLDNLQGLSINVK